MSVYLPKDRKGRPRSPFWHYDFVVDGRRFCGSTGATSRRQAELVERAARERARARPDLISIEGAFAQWWTERGQHDAGADDTTFPRLERLQDELTAILAEDGEPAAIGAIRTRHLVAYVARRRRQPNRRNRLPAAATINRELQVLRRVMRHAAKVWEMPVALPDFGRALLDEADPRQIEITAAIEAAIRASLRPDFHDLLDWLILSGSRRGNALDLTADQVDLAARTVTLFVKSRRPGGRRVVLPLTDQMVALLANNIGRHPDAVFTFVAQRTDHRKGYVRGERYPIRPEHFYHQFKAAAAAAGHPKIRPHDCRHTAATRTTRATGNIRIAQRQLGHTRVTTTERYAHVLDEDLRTGLQAAHDDPRNRPGKTEPDTAKPLKSGDNRKRAKRS